ncbi:GNAT family N-acetyltransferase [filamentous cyanobacterium LEGE 11480]|uniref:GNAT family N-acetyltransferase n=2 Tax=Romeriopsis TaxID=2992131 RepID=A0A928Z668_9CYAN|nr:GNAT family N-acetyltransferase [Romeriopsis navalis LEGE 11480]
MVQLRPNLQSAEFVGQIQQQFDRGYQLVSLRRDNLVLAVAGFHISTNLAWGKHLYIEDLVVDGGHQSQQYGQRLFQWLIDFARQHHCAQAHLDSGVQRFSAHRFYLHQRLEIRSHHFAMTFN